MQKYIIVKEWLGSKPVGTVIELDKVHPSLETNLRLVGGADLEEVDLKKENTALKSKATKAENALKEAEAKIELLESNNDDLAQSISGNAEVIEDLRLQIAELEAKLADTSKK